MQVKLLLLLLCLATSFTLPEDPTVLKGRLKRIDFYLSATHEDYSYNTQGQLICIQKPYGKKVNYSYSGNITYIETIDPRGFTRYDTLIHKASNLTDTILTEKGFWLPQYDLERNLTSEVYVPLTGKKRKPTTPKYLHTYSYYCNEKADSNSFNYPCDNIYGHHFKKSHVCVDAKGDTVYQFNFSYRFDKNGKVITAMKYYSTGQLYDSVGYTYY